MHNKELEDFIVKHKLMNAQLSRLLGVKNAGNTITNWGKKNKLTRLQHLALVGLEAEGWEPQRTSPQRWSSKEAEQLLALVGRQERWKDIAKSMNRSVGSVMRKYASFTRKIGKPKKPMAIKQEDIAIICDLFSRGVPRSKIAKQFGRGFKLIDSIITTNHVPVREAAE